MELKEFWNNRYKNGQTSGYGSYGDIMLRKLGWLVGLEGINSVSEIGCGDFNFGKHVMAHYPQATYIGNDLSEYIVKKNNLLYPPYKFTLGDVPDADLLLCIDVLLHQIDDKDWENLLNRLDNYTKYLAVTAYERDEEYTENSHVRIRKFDYKRYGKPLIREISEENGEMYFYLFKR